MNNINFDTENIEKVRDSSDSITIILIILILFLVLIKDLFVFRRIN